MLNSFRFTFLILINTFTLASNVYSSEYFRIINVGTGKCIDSTDGSHLEQWFVHGNEHTAPQQFWKWSENGCLIDKKHGKYLEIMAGLQDLGREAGLTSRDWGGHCRWTHTSKACLINQGNGRYLEILGGDDHDEIVPSQTDRDWGAHTKWKLEAATRVTVFLITANISFSGDVYKHAGIRFCDHKHRYPRDIECHFHPVGVVSGQTGEELIGGLNSTKRDKVLGELSFKDANYCESWCEDWAARHDYDLIETNCWTMVQSFCRAHNLRQPKPPAHQTLSQAAGELLPLKVMYDTAKHIEKGHLDKAAGTMLSGGCVKAVKHIKKLF